MALAMMREGSSAGRESTRGQSSSARRLGTDLWERYQQLRSQRQLFDQDYQDIVELITPGAADITRKQSPGESRTDRLFDTTAIRASQGLAANMMGSVTNPAVEWFRLRFRDGVLNDSQEVARWLAATDDLMLTSYNASNFYPSAHTYYRNYADFGTAAMFVGMARSMQGHLRFRTLPTGSYAIAENDMGMVDTLCRIIPMTPRQAVQAFGELRVSRMTRERARSPREKDVQREVLHCVYPREDYALRAPGKAGNRNMPYASVYMEADTQEVVDESGFEEFPFLVSRWETLSDSPYGFGPGHLALPDVRTLNTLRELHLQQLTLWVQPPMKVLREGVIGNISLESLALNVVTSQDALQPMDIGGRPDLVQIDQAELRQSIRDAY